MKKFFLGIIALFQQRKAFSLFRKDKVTYTDGDNT